MTGTAPISEHEVRDLVRRVVDGLLDETTTRSPATTPSTTALDEQPSPASSDRIAIGADHGGVKLKDELVRLLDVAGYDVVDCGTDGPHAVNYPEFAHAVARQVADGRCRWGIVVDGAGIGSAMTANKVPGIRAAACYDLSTARNSREHNHANVLTLGAGLTGPALAWQIVQEWLSVPWGPERHARRVAMITDIEHTYTGGGT